eukprot:SAG31_NODE_994_length_10499_cov_6.293452_3_plen_62_part_00
MTSILHQHQYPRTAVAGPTGRAGAEGGRACAECSEAKPVPAVHFKNIDTVPVPIARTYINF